MNQAQLFPSPIQKHDPGGKVRVPVPPSWKCSAVFSQCERYRFALERIWNDVEEPKLVFFLWMNPSTGTEKVSDPTIIRGCNLAQFWGYDGILVANCHPQRETDKRNLGPIGEDLIVENLRHIHRLAARAELHVMAFGHLGKDFQHLADRTVAFLLQKGYRGRLYHLGLSTDGVPRHLLSRGKQFVAKDATPQPWEPTL